MIFAESAIAGVFEINLEPATDVRGWFARVFDREIFATHGLECDFPQVSASWNRRQGTLRGIHFQRSPGEETKVVRCVRGQVFDVVVDLRPNSPTYLAWAAFDLSGDRATAVYLPKGCGHGFLTLAPDTELTYLISTSYDHDLASGVRYDDPRIGVDWPMEPAVISERDRQLPLWSAG